MCSSVFRKHYDCCFTYKLCNASVLPKLSSERWFSERHSNSEPFITHWVLKGLIHVNSLTEVNGIIYILWYFSDISSVFCSRIVTTEQEGATSKPLPGSVVHINLQGARKAVSAQAKCTSSPSFIFDGMQGIKVRYCSRSWCKVWLNRLIGYVPYFKWLKWWQTMPAGSKPDLGKSTENWSLLLILKEIDRDPISNFLLNKKLINILF